MNGETDPNRLKKKKKWEKGVATEGRQKGTAAAGDVHTTSGPGQREGKQQIECNPHELMQKQRLKDAEH